MSTCNVAHNTSHVCWDSTGSGRGRGVTDTPDEIYPGRLSATARAVFATLDRGGRPARHNGSACESETRLPRARGETESTYNI
eukprot:2834685-Prymnesium_polylepis.1